MTNDDTFDLDVLVIGAGQSGLALAWHLRERGLRFLLVDAAPEIGHSWQRRWDSLRLFSPAQYDGLPGMPFPAAADTYPGKDEVAAYLRAYAARNAFPVRTATRVERLAPTGGGFVAQTSQGTLRARQVVVATGAFHHAHVPELAGDLAATVSQVHSNDYRNPEQLGAAGRVLVVGAGNSGLQIAGELAERHQVLLAVGSQCRELPQRFAGRDLFWWLTRLGLMKVSAESRVGRRFRDGGELAIGSSVAGLRRRGVDVRPRLVAVDGTEVRFADDTVAHVDAVVWATGFRSDYSWIDAPVCGPDGRVRHDQGRSAVPGLWFLGLPWQRTRGSSLLGFVQRDAELVAGLIAAELDREVPAPRPLAHAAR